MTTIQIDGRKYAVKDLPPSMVEAIQRERNGIKALVQAVRESDSPVKNLLTAFGLRDQPLAHLRGHNVEPVTAGPMVARWHFRNRSENWCRFRIEVMAVHVACQNNSGNNFRRDRKFRVATFWPVSLGPGDS